MWNRDRLAVLGLPSPDRADPHVWLRLDRCRVRGRRCCDNPPVLLKECPMTTFHGPDLAFQAINNLRMADQALDQNPEMAAHMRSVAQTCATLALAAATLAAAGGLTEESEELWAAGLDPQQRGVQ